MGDDIFELAEEIADSGDGLLDEGTDLGRSALGGTADVVGETFDDAAQASATSVGAIAGEAITVADKALNAAEEINNFAEQAQHIQDTLHTNMDATLSGTDMVHQSIQGSAAASRQAWENNQISWEDHQANIDRLAQNNLQHSAAVDEQIQGQVASAQAGTAAAAASGIARGLAKTVSPVAEVAGLPVVGEAILETVGLPQSIE